MNRAQIIDNLQKHLDDLELAGECRDDWDRGWEAAIRYGLVLVTTDDDKMKDIGERLKNNKTVTLDEYSRYKEWLEMQEKDAN